MWGGGVGVSYGGRIMFFFGWEVVGCWKSIKAESFDLTHLPKLVASSELLGEATAPPFC